jgi:hypothetical protein
MLAAVLLTVSPAMAAGKSDKFVVVIDAGHGGHDAGALGSYATEKSINLGVARYLGQLLEKEKGIKVVYTRMIDKFVTLQGRADIANRAKGDLFVSIHTNSVDKNAKNRASVRGAAVYTLGLERTDANLAVAMRENSVMKLEDDYTTTYEGFDPTSSESYIIFELGQNKHMQQSVRAAGAVLKELASTAGRKNNGVRQANFWVLLKTAMPAMLVELDFICNPTEEQFMASDRGKQKLAQSIYNGIMNYYEESSGRRAGKRQKLTPVRNNELSTSSSEKEKPGGAAQEREARQPEKNEPKSVKPAADTPVYKIQFLLSPRKLAAGSQAFKGLSPVEYYIDNGTYKYTYGHFSSQQEAAPELKRVRKFFHDAFIIKTVNEKRVK